MKSNQVFFNQKSIHVKSQYFNAEYSQGIFLNLLNAGLSNEVFCGPVKWLSEKSKLGCSNAQANLGIAYVFGIGVTKNPEKAVYWFKCSASQGNALGLYNLGVACEDLQVESLSCKDAERYYSLAAVRGFDEATLRLCQIDADSGDPSKTANAYKTIKRLTRRQGVSGLDIRRKALYWQGGCYLCGRGVKVNFREGLYKTIESASLGYIPAQDALCTLISTYTVCFPSFDIDWLKKGFCFCSSPISNKLKFIWSCIVPKYVYLNNIGFVNYMSDEEIQNATLIGEEIIAEIDKISEALFRHQVHSLQWASDSGIIELHEINRRHL